MNVFKNERGSFLVQAALIAAAIFLFLAGTTAMAAAAYWPGLILYILSAALYPVGNAVLQKRSKSLYD